MYKINVAHYPVPQYSAQEVKYPFRNMKSGDSFDVPDEDVNAGYESKAKVIRACAKLQGCKIKTRVKKSGKRKFLRVWKV